MTSLIQRCIMSWRDAWGLEEWHGCCGRKSFYYSKLALLNDDDDDEEETFGEFVQSTKQLKKIRRWVEMPKKKDSIVMTTKMPFPLDLDGYFFDSFPYDFTDVLLWLTHLILAHDSTHSSSSFPLSPIIHTMSNRSSLIVIHFYSYDSFSCVASSFFPWLRYCAYWGCMSWPISDTFLTHIILHAGRIFWQWHRNCIVCLVVESALHVYKGQFSPWFGSDITGILIQRKFINSASVTVQPKCLTSRIGVSQILGIFGLNPTSSLLTS